MLHSGNPGTCAIKSITLSPAHPEVIDEETRLFGYHRNPGNSQALSDGNERLWERNPGDPRPRSVSGSVCCVVNMKQLRICSAAVAVPQVSRAGSALSAYVRSPQTPLLLSGVSLLHCLKSNRMGSLHSLDLFYLRFLLTFPPWKPLEQSGQKKRLRRRLKDLFSLLSSFGTVTWTVQFHLQKATPNPRHSLSLDSLRLFI